MIMLILVIHGVIWYLMMLFVVIQKFLMDMEVFAPFSTTTMNINPGLSTATIPMIVATRKCSLEHVLETSARDYGMNAFGCMLIVFAVILGVCLIMLIQLVTIPIQIAVHIYALQMIVRSCFGKRKILYVWKGEVAMSSL